MQKLDVENQLKDAENVIEKVFALNMLLFCLIVIHPTLAQTEINLVNLTMWICATCNICLELLLFPVVLEQ